MSSPSNDNTPAMDYPKYIRETLIPKILAEGRFERDLPADGDADGNIVIGGVKVEAAGGLGVDHWASSTLFVEVALQRERGRLERTINLVVKFVSPGDGFQEFSLVDEMARNEGRMYNTILPFFDEMWAHKIGTEEAVAVYPRCFGAELTDPILVVMENLRTQGFRLTDSRTFLDKHHLFVAVRKLGRFHALSYAAKIVNPEKFRSLATALRETHYIPEKKEAHTTFLSSTVLRGIQPLEKEISSPDDNKTFERIKERLTDPYKIMFEAANTARSTEKESLAIVSHGDFLRNNMLFKYDENGLPIDTRFFDFQTSRYTTPAYDLALFLFMNTTSEVRNECWEDIFTKYHDSLSSTAKRIVGSTSTGIPSLEDIKNDFKRNALYGYCICSFFLPVMIAPPNPEEFMDPETDRSKKSSEEVAQMMSSIGGEEATGRVTDILRDVIKYKLL